MDIPNPRLNEAQRLLHKAIELDQLAICHIEELKQLEPDSFACNKTLDLLLARVMANAKILHRLQVLHSYLAMEEAANPAPRDDRVKRLGPPT